MKTNIFNKCIIAIIFLTITLVCVSSCDSGIKGTYVWDNNGYEFSVTISSNGESGPCVVHTTVPGRETIQTSYNYFQYGWDRPQIDIDDIAIIDPQNLRVYYSDSDFEAARNGHPCTKR